MLRLRRLALLFIIILFSALPRTRGLQLRSAYAQDPGVAVITAPLEGAVVSGIVPLLGTATHPQFQRYELAFGYDPNPTDTWFSIGDPGPSPIANDVLGRWDTTHLVDGAYLLRLRVYWSERDFLETFVRHVRVQNATPTATPAAIGTPTPRPADIITPSGGDGTQPAIALPPTSTPRPTPGQPGIVGGGSSPAFTTRLNARLIAEAFLNGVRLTAIIFALLGTYVGLRAFLRSRSRR
jgi:hypothetical protein